MFYAVYLCVLRVRTLFPSFSFSSLMEEKCRNFVFKSVFSL